jgi:glycosyltransferase involved in cell wall biosynthesis
MKKILFISYDASRTGAPILLLHLLRWIKQNTDLPFEVLLRRGGEMLDDFRALAPARVIEKPASRSLAALALKRLGLSDPVKAIGKYYDAKEFGLIYANTVSNGDIIEALRWDEVPVLTHVHELEFAIRHFQARGSRDVFTRSAHFIACAGAVKDVLQREHQVDPVKVDVVHEFIDTEQFSKQSGKGALPSLWKDLNIPDDAFVVGACGRTDWRKGADLFLPLAILTSAKSEKPIHFVWMGGMMHEKERAAILHDLERIELRSRVHYIGNQQDPSPFYQRMNAFVLLSREDPFPLVCLEAAAAGKPVLCFDRGGGMPEFVRDDAGCVVSYLDLDAMAECIVKLQQDPARCAALGHTAQVRALEQHNIPNGARRIVEIVRHVGQFPVTNPTA